MVLLLLLLSSLLYRLFKTTYLSETKNISTAYNVGAVMYLQFVVHKMLFST